MARARALRTWLGLAPHHVRRARLPWLSNFFADRGTHLSAMIAYYALLSLVPLLFILLLPLTFIGRQTETSFLIKQVSQALPGQSVTEIVGIVNDLRRHATTIGLVGLGLLVWSSLGLLSAIASALNIIYEVPNGSFLRQKLQILGLIAAAFTGVLLSLTGVTALSAWASSYSQSVLGIMSVEEMIGLAFSAITTGVFLYLVYRYIPNTPVTSREVLPGVLFGVIAFQLSFRLLPFYVRVVATVPTLKALGGIVVLLVWFFLMGNVLLLGAEINWWYGRGRKIEAALDAPKGPGLSGARPQE